VSLRVPIIRGLIDRRILVNYRCTPEPLAELLPPPFRPKLVRGFGIAGICLIRLRHVRPRGFPAIVGISSENAAHRIAVEWEDAGQIHEGVYIPRRDSGSRLNHLLGGRVFPGVRHRARFDVRETGDALHVALSSDDREVRVSVDGTVADALPGDSVFANLEEASTFFRGGSVGYSPAANDGALDGMELCTQSWEITPLHVSNVCSSFFENPERFPSGSTTFDNALLMRGIEHEWHGRDTLYCGRVA
jgi:hypothetical protein